MERIRRWSRQHPDAVVAVVLAVACAGILGQRGVLGQPDALPDSIAVIGVGVLVAWRQRHPLAIAVGAGVLIAVPEFTRYGSRINNSALFVPMLTAVFLYAFAIGAGSEWRRSLVGLAALIAGVNLTGGPFNPLAEMITMGPWAAGLVVASRRRSVDQLELRARELEAERGVFAVQSVRYERARIARELHDIVAHCVSLIVVQANAGERLTRQDPDSAAEAFESISEAARQAEIEIDRLVELLATASPAAAPAGLRIVEELVRRVQASGLRVTCEFSGDSDTLCEPSAEAAYRLVQEGLTNAMKHAPGAPVLITVRGERASVDVQVVNEPAAATSSRLADTGGGNGVAGMRERVIRAGGTFHAGPTAAGGWQVMATLPRRLAAGPTAVPQQAAR
jgi:signal transduction histidine kinase